MKLRVSCNLRFQVTEASVLILMLRPYRGIQQWINREVYTIKPAIPMLESTDSFGNSCQRLVAPVGDFLIHTSAEVMVIDRIESAPGASFVEIQQLPNEVLPFLLPSRYCESDRLGDLAREITFDTLPGYDQVSKITQWVRSNINYLPGSSEIPLSAVEVRQVGHGVCRDLAQLAIALAEVSAYPRALSWVICITWNLWICMPGWRLCWRSMVYIRPYTKRLAWRQSDYCFWARCSGCFDFSSVWFRLRIKRHGRSSRFAG